MSLKNQLFILLLFLGACATPPPPVVKKKIIRRLSPTGITYLNRLRKQLGMIPLKSNQYLSRAAKNHARYLTKFGYKEGHVERFRKSKLFTGKKVNDRVLYANYKTNYSSENIAPGPSVEPHYFQYPISKAAQVVTDLMSAIYHRFTFLDYTVNEIGFGQASKNYVYNLGNSYLNKLCSKKQSPIRGNFYTNLCKHKGRMIKVELKDKAVNKVVRQNKKDYILFPAPGLTNVHPVFYNEIPDPLPDLNMSGNPISLHFGPHIKSPVKITYFELKNEKTKQRLKIRQLNHKNDPHQKFRPNHFAFFPVQRLDWNTSYKAQLTYQIKKKKKTIRWSFKTRKLKYKTITIPNRRPGTLHLRRGQKVMLYFRPEKLNELNNKFRINFKYYDKKPNVKLKVFDSNTVFFQVKSSAPGQLINIFYKVENKKKNLKIKIDN